MIKVIKKESEYIDALNQIEALISLDPKEGSIEAQKLELLALLVKDYESTRYFLADVSDPVDAIIFRMEQENLKPRDLMKYIGSRSKVSEVLSRKRPLSLNMIRALKEGLGIPLKSLVKNSDPEIGSNELKWDHFPIKEMTERKWIHADASHLDEDLETLVKNFLFPLRGPNEIFALHRKTEHIRSARKLDDYALFAWTARIITLADNLEVLETYHKESVNEDFFHALIKLSTKDRAPVAVQNFLKDNGIALVFEPQLPRTYLDGAVLIHKEMPIIGMTIRYDRLDNFWFTLIHELAHLHLHLNNDQTSFFDDLDLDEPTDNYETEADYFASEILIPEEEWTNSPASVLRSPEAAQHLASKLKIHPAIVVGRMRYKFKNYKMLNNIVGHNEVRKYFPEIKWKK